MRLILNYLFDNSKSAEDLNDQVFTDDTIVKACEKYKVDARKAKAYVRSRIHIQNDQW